VLFRPLEYRRERQTPLSRRSRLGRPRVFFTRSWLVSTPDLSRHLLPNGSEEIQEGSWMTPRCGGSPLPNAQAESDKALRGFRAECLRAPFKHGRIDRDQSKHDRAQHEFGWSKKLNSTHSSCQTRPLPAKVRFVPNLLWYRFQLIFAEV
jgi:hypothetical protein